MIICRSIPQLRMLVSDWQKRGERIGLVPTMGYLHEGHLSLVDQIRTRCERIIVSIFVNPTQFAPHEDFDRYPRDFQRDELLLDARGVEALFYPEVEEIYPPEYRTFIEVEKLAEILCGRSRPTHFRGVATIVAKLFLISKCNVAAFGQKDYQQAQIIKRMTEDLNFDLEILICPIVREADGLAMSSRNQYLSPGERGRAICLSRALIAAQQHFTLGERRAAKLREEMQRLIEAVPEVEVDYLEVVDAGTLEPVEIVNRKTLCAGAIRVGKTRLIDNLILEPK